MPADPAPLQPLHGSRRAPGHSRRRTPAGTAPAGSGYTTIAGIGVAVCVTTALVAWLALGRRPSPLVPGEPAETVTRGGRLSAT